MNIDEIEKLARAATPGPWELFSRRRTNSIGNNGDLDTVVHWMGFEAAQQPYAKQRANAAYIAALSPERIIAMCAVIKAADALVDDCMFKDHPRQIAAYDAARKTL